MLTSLSGAKTGELPAPGNEKSAVQRGVSGGEWQNVTGLRVKKLLLGCDLMKSSGKRITTL